MEIRIKRPVFYFEREMMLEVCKNLSNFEKMLMAMTSDGIEDKNIAKHLGIQNYRISYKKKRTMLQILKDMQAYYKSDRSIPYNNINAFLRECREDGYISYPKDNSEFVKAYLAETSSSPVKRKPYCPINHKKMRNLVETFIKNRPLPTIVSN